MTITITIKCDNEAFGQTDGDRSAEVARILRDTADRWERAPYTSLNLRDANGNTVGRLHESADDDR